MDFHNYDILLYYIFQALIDATVRQIGIYFVSISIASSLVETKNTLLPLLLS